MALIELLVASLALLAMVAVTAVLVGALAWYSWDGVRRAVYGDADDDDRPWNLP